MLTRLYNIWGEQHPLMKGNIKGKGMKKVVVHTNKHTHTHTHTHTYSTSWVQDVYPGSPQRNHGQTVDRNSLKQSWKFISEFATNTDKLWPMVKWFWWTRLHFTGCARVEQSVLILTPLFVYASFPEPHSHPPSYALDTLFDICLPPTVPAQQQATSAVPSIQPPTGYAYWTAESAGLPAREQWQVCPPLDVVQALVCPRLPWSCSIGTTSSRRMFW